MNLYLLQRDDIVKWNECIGAVIAAHNTQEAIDTLLENDDKNKRYSWTCSLISRTVESEILNREKGIVLTSYSENYND